MAVIVITIAAIYLFIPSHLTIGCSVNVRCTAEGASRLLQHEESWVRWWPDASVSNGKDSTKYSYNHFTYTPDKKLYNKRMIITESNKVKALGSLNILSYSIDSLQLLWLSDLQTSMNPFTRLFQYQQTKKLKKDMNEILNRMKVFLRNDENIYGYKIVHTTLKDTALVAIKTATKDSPSTSVIYGMINDLEKYIVAEGALKTSFPMLNITRIDSNHFVTMVAIGTSKVLPDKGNIFLKRMIPYPDKILTTDAKGGAAGIRRAYEIINLYMRDHQLSSPVIHFEYLVTDRLKETDSTKWITRIYMPII